MSQPKTYFFDVDGVLVDLITPICRLHRLHATTLNRQLIGADVTDGVMGWTHDNWNHWDQWKTWNWPSFTPHGISVADIYDEHEPLPYDSEALAKLNMLCEASQRNELDGNTVLLLTQCSEPEATQAKKNYFIRRGFPGLSKALLSVVNSEEKHQFCHGQNSVIVDDKPQTIREWSRAGGHGYLMERPWNQTAAQAKTCKGILDCVPSRLVDMAHQSALRHEAPPLKGIDGAWEAVAEECQKLNEQDQAYEKACDWDEANKDLEAAATLKAEKLQQTGKWELEEIDVEDLEREAKEESVCEEADRLTSGDRQAAYGPPDQDFTRTADMANALWSHKLSAKLDSVDVAMFMILLKLSRQTHQTKRDNWVDIAGYAKCGHMCDEVKRGDS